MSDYKSTLNLPKTDFPMKANLPQREPSCFAKWEQEGLYQQIRHSRENCEKYILHDGPPYANGQLHAGHAVNKILKDIVIKSQTLSNKDAPFIPTWDCHGLPIELQVEKKHGRKVTQDPKDFKHKCRTYAAKQVEIQKTGFKRMGVFGEWDSPALTMNFDYEANIIRTLAQMIDQGHLHQGFKPVHWCPSCGSSLAEAEVEYKDKTSTQIYVGFEVESQAQNQINKHIIIWTTTPWTLPANQAVCVHPEVEYVWVEGNFLENFNLKSNSKTQSILLAKARAEEVMNVWGIENFKINNEIILGKDLEGLKLKHPFLNKTVPIILGDHVTTDSGTGLVHTAPAHGLEDFAVCKKYNISGQSPVMANGCFAENIDLVGGEFYTKANPIILEKLKSNHNLFYSDSLEHSYPHCWRHKTPVIFRATPQWFISMTQNNLRDKAMDEIAKTQWLPKSGQSRIESMVGDRPDWCISRQRLWGVPLGLLTHKTSGKLHPDTIKLLFKLADQVESKGVEAWDDLDLNQFLDAQDKDLYEKNTDILDVWFDSGASNYCVLEQRKNLQFPADLYLEGSDQHRGWFQTSLLTAVARGKSAPFKTVLTHGFVVDQNGHKMSKSQGNGISPDEIMKNSGADILRLWVASSDYKYEMRLSQDALKRTSDIYRRIRNTAKFLLSNLTGFDPLNPEHNLLNNHTQNLVALDQWIIERCKNIQDKIKSYFNQYQFHQVVQDIHHFCAQDLGGFYLDIIKDRQYTCPENSHARRSAQTAMYHIVQALALWLSPICLFTAQEIWENIPGYDLNNTQNKTIFTQIWHTFPKFNNSNNNLDWDSIILLKNKVNKALENLRAEKIIKSSLAANINLYLNAEWKNILSPVLSELRFILISAQVNIFNLNEYTGEQSEDRLDGLELLIQPSEAEKCARCWHHHPSVGQNKDTPDICERCVENLSGEGERRVFA